MGLSSPIHNVRQTSQGVSLTFKGASLGYLTDFINMKCSPDILATRVFPNAKEITESMGAFVAHRKNLLSFCGFGDRSRTAFVIGDGSTPRTGVLLAFLTRWSVVSLDPNMKGEWSGIERIRTAPIKIEDLAERPKDGDAVFMVHSHAPIAAVERWIGGASVSVVSIPCCVQHRTMFGRPPMVEYADWRIHSPERTVKIWKSDPTGKDQ